MHSCLGFSLLRLESRRALPGLQPLPVDLHSDSSCIPGLAWQYHRCLHGWAIRGDSWRCRIVSFSFSPPQIWHPTNKPSPMTSSCISRWMPLSPTEGNLQPLLSSPSLWCPYFIKALWALKPHFTEFAPHPRLFMSQNQSCPFRPEGRERVSVLPQKSQAASCFGSLCPPHNLASQHPSFFTCVAWALAFARPWKPCLSPIRPLLSSSHSPFRRLLSAPWCCTSLGETMEEVRASTSLWAVAADLLRCYFQPLPQIQNLLIQVGRLKFITALGVL